MRLILQARNDKALYLKANNKRMVEKTEKLIAFNMKKYKDIRSCL